MATAWSGTRQCCHKSRRSLSEMYIAPKKTKDMRDTHQDPSAGRFLPKVPIGQTMQLKPSPAVPAGHGPQSAVKLGAGRSVQLTPAKQGLLSQALTSTQRRPLATVPSGQSHWNCVDGGGRSTQTPGAQAVLFTHASKLTHRDP